MQVKRKTVTPGTLSGAQIHIYAGIKTGDILVSTGVHFLQEGEKIRPITRIKGQ